MARLPPGSLEMFTPENHPSLTEKSSSREATARALDGSQPKLTAMVLTPLVTRAQVGAALSVRTARDCLLPSSRDGKQ